MAQRWRVLIAHGVTFVLGMLCLAWLALPLGAGPWQISPSLHWQWLLAPAVLLGVASGVCQGIIAGFGWVWPTLVPLVPASVVALWSAGLFTAPSLFGAPPERPSPEDFIAAVAGWALYVAVALVMALGVGYVVASLVKAARQAR